MWCMDSACPAGVGEEVAGCAEIGLSSMLLPRGGCREWCKGGLFLTNFHSACIAPPSRPIRRRAGTSPSRWFALDDNVMILIEVADLYHKPSYDTTSCP